jgi:hypothetical protein
MIFDDTISGEFILKVLNSFDGLTEWVSEFLKNYNIELQADKNYTLHFCAQLINQLREKSGPLTIYKIGMETAKLYKLPLNLELNKNPHNIFSLSNQAYKLNVKTHHDVQFYFYEYVNDKALVFKSQTPFSCEFEKGFFYGIFDFYFNITDYLIEHSPRWACRNLGCNYCNYIISWK